MESLTALSKNLGELLKAKQQTVAIAESSTGGLLSAALLAVPGASAFFNPREELPPISVPKLSK
ncbi:MAG: CinA family protein [SAR324 cluster bacterium]|nr:CinA family protein [SAR324 cluster bacterium]